MSYGYPPSDLEFTTGDSNNIFGAQLGPAHISAPVPSALVNHASPLMGNPNLHNNGMYMDWDFAVDPSKFGQPHTAQMLMMPVPRNSQTDGFLDWDFEAEASSSTEPWRATRFELCPSCTQQVDVSVTSFHSHVTECFISLNRGSKGGEDGEEASVQKVQQFISKMDLRTRLGMMESLNRLSKSHDAGEMSATGQPMSPKTPNDQCVLHLLYGKCDPSSVIDNAE